MSEMRTPASFVAASALAMFFLTVLMTIDSESIVVFGVGMAMTLGLSRAMIGIGE